MNLMKIAGLLALSAATVAGVSLVPTSAQAAEEAEAEENIALETENEGVDADEGATDESADAIHRRFRRYPGYYYPYYGPRYYPSPYYRPGFRRYYRPYYSPYYYPYYPYYHRYYGPGSRYWW